MAAAIGHGRSQLAGFGMANHSDRAGLCGGYFVEGELLAVFQSGVAGMVLATDGSQRALETEFAVGEFGNRLVVAQRNAIGYLADNRVTDSV